MLDLSNDMESKEVKYFFQRKKNVYYFSADKMAVEFFEDINNLTITNTLPLILIHDSNGNVFGEYAIQRHEHRNKCYQEEYFGKKVGDIKDIEVIVVDSETSIQEVRMILSAVESNYLSHCLVMEAGNVVGIMTSYDLPRSNLSGARSPKHADIDSNDGWGSNEWC